MSKNFLSTKFFYKLKLKVIDVNQVHLLVQILLKRLIYFYIESMSQLMNVEMFSEKHSLCTLTYPSILYLTHNYYETKV